MRLSKAEKSHERTSSVWFIIIIVIDLGKALVFVCGFASLSFGNYTLAQLLLLLLLLKDLPCRKFEFYYNNFSEFSYCSFFYYDNKLFKIGERRVAGGTLLHKKRKETKRLVRLVWLSVIEREVTAFFHRRHLPSLFRERKKCAFLF